MQQRDVFICHASKDKEEVVTPMVGAFTQAGITCWYDEAEIKWGDSITRKVNEGLGVSRYVIVVLSEAFIERNWPQRELSALLNTEASTGEVKVLPVLVGSERQRSEILNKYPLLNDKRYISWDGDLGGVVDALCRRLNKESPGSPLVVTRGRAKDAPQKISRRRPHKGPGREAEGLLRTAVADLFDIRACEIRIQVRRDLRTADYLYSYTIRKTRDGPGEWREVFAYPVEEFEIEYARDSNRSGLGYTLESLDGSRNACVRIRLPEGVESGTDYRFEYKCRTRIEAVSNVTMLGGSGCTAFWCAHEFQCHNIRIEFTFPKGVVPKAAHPAVSGELGSSPILFEQANLAPRQFVLAFVIYEKRLLGIPPRWARVAEKFAWIAVGAAVSRLLLLLL